MGKIITLEDYAMGREAIAPEEWGIAKPNAEKLLLAVNALLSELFPNKVFEVSSGFRPKSINSKIPNAAKKSLHTLGLAIDIKDSDNFLKRFLDPENIPKQAEKLRELYLFMESRADSATWCHLDMGSRIDRASRIFRA